MLFREVRTFILVFMQEGEQTHLRSQSILPCPGSQKPLLSTLQRDWSHAWFKAGLPTCWKGCVKRCRAVCSPTYHHIHWFRDAEKTRREVLELVFPHRLTSWQAVTSSGCEQFTRCLVSHVLEKGQGLPTSLLVK